jgi:hypothetical protein
VADIQASRRAETDTPDRLVAARRKAWCLVVLAAGPATAPVGKPQQWFTLRPLDL